MNTITFNEENAKIVENSVMVLFGVNRNAIVGTSDTMVKKVVVFVLSKYFEFNQRHLARAYSINYLYVPTVVEEIEYQMKVDVDFCKKVNSVLESVGYEKRFMDRRTNKVA